MRRNRVITIVLIAFGIIAVLVWAPGPSEPVHKGRPLSAWLVDVAYTQPESIRQEARKAIRAMGTNAIPWLIADLRFKEPGWRRILQAWLQKQSLIKVKYRTPDARSSQATWAFEALGPTARPAIPELVTLLNENPGYAPGALAWIGVEAVPALVTALSHTNRYVQANAGGALANAVARDDIPRSAATAAVPIWINQLQDTSANLRYYAAWGLGTLRQQASNCIPALVKSLDDPVPSVQGASGDGRAVPALTSATRDPNDTVRIWAVGALGTIGKEPLIAVPALLAALKDPNAMVRLKAAEVLGGFGKDAASAVNALHEAEVKDPDERVRKLARQSLRRIAPEQKPR